MREQLIQYVELLFAGAPDSNEIKQEILQNTLDRFDDLVAQGKSPEAAYRLAISGIGDINEILGSEPKTTANYDAYYSKNAATDEDGEKKKKRAVAIALYITCVIPVIALSNLGNGGLGVCLMLLMIGAATALMIMTADKDEEDEKNEKSLAVQTPQQKLKNSIEKFIGAIGLAIYLVISFVTGAWHITWLIFPIEGCIKGLINAVIDLKEACKNEN